MIRNNDTKQSRVAKDSALKIKVPMFSGNRRTRKPRSIFSSLFFPLFLIMILQAFIFYFAAVYGGIEQTLNQNAADIFNERLNNRKNEIETRFNNKWSNLSECADTLEAMYEDFERQYGEYPLTGGASGRIEFLGASADTLVETLRHNEVNGIYLILNDTLEPEIPEGGEQKNGLCIRDMDQDSNYSAREDLLIERSPVALIDVLGCSLDSWWEAKYTFSDESSGDFYYNPLKAAWDEPDADGENLAYFSGTYRISGSDQSMISYSIPLTDANGYPFGVLGVELSVKYLASLMPNYELDALDRCCYILAAYEQSDGYFTPLVGTGSLYNRCFASETSIPAGSAAKTGGFTFEARADVKIYGDFAQLEIYNNNNPFEQRQLTLVALVENNALFAHITRVKSTLLVAALFSLVLGIAGIAFVSRNFASPVTELANRVRGIKSPQSSFELGRLGINEIDQLVQSIEELNRNVSKNSARSEFFSRMSHDMRTPMNAIISFSSDELLHGADESVKDSYLQKIHASGLYLLGLINEVLDMTKIENNKTELHMEAAAAVTLCDMTLPVIDKLAQQKGVKFVKVIDAPETLNVSADKQHLNQIIMNLLSNAVKFTPAGGSINFAFSAKEEDGGVVLCKITVSDTGIGMSEKFMKNLYTPFEQENNAGEGTGLGLSIAHKLVELMKGTINCESRQNRGTTFTVTLPFNKCEAPSAVCRCDEKEDEKSGRDVISGKRILIFEDNDMNSQIVCRLLEKAGAVAVTAKNGAQGLEIFKSTDAGYFDAVLMDMQMPVMDGLEATRRLRQLGHFNSAVIPIIAMTANAFEEDVRACLEAGMNSHLAKPIEPKKFYRTLTEHLS